VDKHGRLQQRQIADDHLMPPNDSVAVVAGPLKPHPGGLQAGMQGRFVCAMWRSCAILRSNLSHDLPHSLGQACRGSDQDPRRAACFSSLNSVLLKYE
jgi:hypothetical protein